MNDVSEAKEKKYIKLKTNLKLQKLSELWEIKKMRVPIFEEGSLLPQGINENRFMEY